MNSGTASIRAPWMYTSAACGASSERPDATSSPCAAWAIAVSHEIDLLTSISLRKGEGERGNKSELPLLNNGNARRRRGAAMSFRQRGHVELVRGHGPAEMKTLRDIATEDRELLEHRLILDALGHHFQVEI